MESSLPLLLTNSTTSQVKLEIFYQPTPLLLAVFLLVSIIGLVGNSIILAVILGSKKFRIKANYLIGNLSIASLLYIVYGAFAALYRNLFLTWSFGLRLCQLYLFFMRVPVAIFSFTTIAICADRNHIVVNPLRPHKSATLIWCQIMSIWISSAVLTIPLGLSGTVEETMSSDIENPTTALHCIESWKNPKTQMGYSIFLFVVVHVTPILVMLKGMWRIRSKMNFLLKTQPLFRSGSDKRVRLMRNNCIFFTIFIICWLPTGIFRIPLDLPKHILPPHLVSALLYYNDLCLTSGYVITCIIPLILFGLSHDLRNYLGALSCRIDKRRHAEEIPQELVPRQQRYDNLRKL